MARRPNIPHKKPAATGTAPAVVPATVGAGTVEAQTDESAGGFDPEKAASELMSLFDEALRGDLQVSQGERDAFSEHFAAALRGVVNAGSFETNDTELTLQESLDQLKQLAADADDGDGALVRQLTSAIAPLELRRTKIAIEFSRRLQTDGQESALAWYRAQQQEAEQSSTLSAEQFDSGSNVVRSLRDEVTSSRSRRLRGPPTRR